MPIRRLLWLCLSLMPLVAQSYQSSFSEVKFDRAKGPATYNAGVAVDAATGAASMSLPMGPGIGQRGIQFRPILAIRIAPQLGITSADENILLSTNSSGVQWWGTQTNDVLYQRGFGSASFSPGTLDLDIQSGTGKAKQTVYSLPAGGGGTVLGTVPPAVTPASIQALLTKFGYGGNDTVGYVPGSTLRTTKVPFIQMGSTGHLVIGLRTSGPSNQLTDEVRDWIQYDMAHSGGNQFDFPRRMLVIQGEVAYEFHYVNHVYQVQSLTYPRAIDKEPLAKAHYLLTKILNRFGESISFTYDSNGIGYVATWNTNGESSVKIQVAVVGKAPAPPLPALGGGTALSSLTQIRVTYQGIRKPISSYLVELSDPATGLSLVDTPSISGAPDGDQANSPNGVRVSILDGDWDQAIRSVQPVRITQEATSESITFGYGTGPTSTWGTLSIAPVVMNSVTYPNRQISLTWNPTWYRTNYSPYSWLGIQSASSPRRPSIAYGVTAVVDTETVTNQSRSTIHTRVAPRSTWGGSNDPEYWLETDFYDAITHPDGSVTVHRFVEPPLSNASTGADGMQNLAFIKNLEREVRWYEPGVDWRADLTRAPGSASTAYKIVVHDRFSVHSVGNPTGVLGFNAVPYPTRTRTWEKESAVLTTLETTDWSVSQYGWSTKHATTALQLSPSLTPEFTSLATNGMAYQAYSAIQGGERVITRTIQSDLSQWFIGRIIGEAPASQQDNTTFLGPTVTLPQAQPPAAMAFDPTFNTLSSVVVGAAGGTQVQTSFAYQGTSGRSAAQLQSVTLFGAGLDLSGQVGVSGYSYDALGFLTGISQKPNASTMITVQQSQDELGRPLTQTDPDGKVTQMDWDAAGRLLSITPPDGDIGTTISYDDVSHRMMTVSKGLRVNQYRFNAFGELILERRKDVNGAWSFKVHGYDPVGRPTGESIWFAGQGESAEEDWHKANLTGSVVVQVETGQRCVQWGWDDDGNRVCISSVPVYSNQTLNAIYKGGSLQYDKRGRLVQSVDANGIVTQTAYLGSAAAPVKASYSPAYVGPIKKVILAPGTAQAQVTYFESDGLGRLVRVTDALNQKTEYRYDGADRLLEVKQFDAQGHVQLRSWEYNHPMKWLTALTQPETGLTTYSDFTVTGKPKTSSYAGRVVRTSYDWLVRPTAVVSVDGTVSQTYSYDSPGALGKLALSTDGGANGVSRSYTYGGAGGRLSTLVTAVRGQSFVQTFGYDCYGNRTSGNTSHEVWNQTFHEATGLPNVLSYAGRTVTNTPWANYDPVSWQVLQIAYGNGVKSTFSYDQDQMRLTSMAHLPAIGGPLEQWSFTYDPTGNLVKENDLVNNTWDQYGYDSLNRLVSALVRSTEFGDQLQTFTYDAFGNRVLGSTQKVTGWSGARGASNPTTTATNLQTTSEVTFDPNSPALYQYNRLPSNTSAGASTGAVYDLQGNLREIWTKPGDNSTLISMNYDALGRVTSLYNKESGITETYVYSAEGLRTVIEIRQGSALQKTKFNIYNDLRQMVSQYELVPAGVLTWKRDVVYLGTREAAEFDGPAASGMHVTQVDHLGSPRVVTGSTGAVESRQKFLPFGELLDSPAPYKPSKGFTGHEQTDPSGLIYMQSRFYIPWVGRFTSPDPGRDQTFEYTQSWNIYSYVRNSPIAKTDPTGMVGEMNPITNGMSGVEDFTREMQNETELRDPARLGRCLGIDKIGAPNGGPPAKPQTNTLSGSSWVSQFPNSTSTADLADGFRQNAESFISAMETAGATVDVSSTLRPPERAYLMHYSYAIAKEGLDPAQVPAMAGVNIDWVHKKADGSADLAASKTAAQQMVSGYGIVFKPALTSRHTEGHAIDMTISWSGNLNIKNASGASLNITGGTRNGSNTQLIQVGATYGLIKLVSDPPHWSNDGH